MLHHRNTGKKWPDDGPPLGKPWRLAKTDRVVFQRVPEYLQDVTLGAFDAPVDLVALKPRGLVDNGFQTTFNGFFKFGIQSGVNADVGKFKNHEGLHFLGKLASG